jgi:hypothetical protein
MRTRPAFPLMRRAFLALLLVELLVITGFAWRSWVWLEWSKLGPDAFPGSPDAAYLYYTCQRAALWSGRFLIGTWIFAGASLAICSTSPSRRTEISPAVGGALVALPVAALLISHLLGASAQG